MSDKIANLTFFSFFTNLQLRHCAMNVGRWSMIHKLKIKFFSLSPLTNLKLKPHNTAHTRQLNCELALFFAWAESWDMKQQQKQQRIWKRRERENLSLASASTLSGSKSSLFFQMAFNSFVGFLIHLSCETQSQSALHWICESKLGK